MPHARIRDCMRAVLAGCLAIAAPAVPAAVIADIQDLEKLSLEELTNHMAGGTELAALKHELSQVRGVDVEELPEADALTAPVASSEGKS